MRQDDDIYSSVDAAKREEWREHDAKVTKRRRGSVRTLIIGALLFLIIYPAVFHYASYLEAPLYREASERAEAASEAGNTQDAIRFYEEAGDHAAAQSFIQGVGAFVGLIGLVMMIAGIWGRLRAGRTTADAIRATRNRRR